jgi:hypothetical protein
MDPGDAVQYLSRAIFTHAGYEVSGNADGAGGEPVHGDPVVRPAGAQGLVRRHRLAGDRRSVRIALIAPGRDLVAEVTYRRRAELARLLGALPAEQHEPVIAAFRAFAATADELPQPRAALGWAGP